MGAAPKTKTCIICGAAFHVGGKGSGRGTHSAIVCSSECRKKRNAERIVAWELRHPGKRKENADNWKRNNPEKHARAMREGQRRYKKKYPEKHRLNQKLRKARKRGAEGTFSATDIDARLKLQDNRCAGCRRKFGKRLKPTVDHITPLTKGGTNWPRNIQLMCVRCNSSKRALDPIEYARRLGFLL